MASEDLLTLRCHTLPMEGLTRDYHFLHITDTHIVLYGKGETKARAAYAAPRARAFALDGMPSWRRFDAMLAFAAEHADALDGVLLTGDILDFPSPENIAYLKARLEKLPVPYIYLLGNHDWAYFDEYQTEEARRLWRPLLAPFCGGDCLFASYQIGELTFAAIDNGMELYEEGVATRLEQALAGAKNAVVLQHIPFYAPTLHADTVAYWKRDINIGGEGICKNEEWKAVRRLVTEPGSPVRAVIAGHLHFWHEDWLDGRVLQYLTSEGSRGNMNWFTFTPKCSEEKPVLLPGF